MGRQGPPQCFIAPWSPRFRDWVKGWFSSPPSTVISGIGHANLSLFGNATAESGPPPKATLGQRVALLEMKHTALLKNVAGLKSQVSADKQELMARISEETAKVSRAVEEVKSNLREVQSGTLHIEAIGVVFFGLGSILSTIPEEAAHFLWWAWGIK